MSTPTKSLIVAICGALVLSVSAAQARVYNDATAGVEATKPSLAKNFRSDSGKTFAKSRKTSSGKYASKWKSKKRHASDKRSRSSLKNRSFVKYASGGASRSCLQPQARALLNRIESQFGPVSIISTCRPGAVIATTGKPSKHRYGLAIDFDAGSRKGAIVNWLMANHHSGGTMTYRNMSHIHVDIGPRFVSLNANSGRRG